MPLTNITTTDIIAIETALSLKLPDEYIQFVTRYPFPDLAYMGAEDLMELHQLDKNLIITINENLRESALSSFHWREEWLSIGERVGDEAVYYLDTTKTNCAVYGLEADGQEGVVVAESFAVWADEIIQNISAADERCTKWHTQKQSRIWPFLRWLTKKKA